MGVHKFVFVVESYPFRENKPHPVALSLEGKLYASQASEKEVSSIDEWNKAFRIMVQVILNHPVLSPESKAQLAKNLNTYINFVNDLAESGADWKY